MIAEVARLLKENKNKPLDCILPIPVQEEVGLYGAEMIANTIKPNIAIVTDVTYDTTTPFIDKKRGRAKMWRWTSGFLRSSVHHNIRTLITDTAKAKNSFQEPLLAVLRGQILMLCSF